MNFLSWNCRGLGNTATGREAREFTAKFTPALFCVSETQISKERAEASAGQLGFSKSFAVASLGRSVGLVVFWNDDIEVEILSSNRYHIDTVVKGLCDVAVRVTCVYGEAQVVDRYRTWDDMK